MTSSQSPLKKEEMQFCRSEWKGQGLDPSGLHGISCTSLGLILWLGGRDLQMTYTRTSLQTESEGLLPTTRTRSQGGGCS